VAEDHALNWMLMARMLGKRGLVAANAADGRQAVEMLAENHYDLVLMDCHMPLLDGFGSARVIRHREEAQGGRRIPIVGITASATRADRDRCLAAGMDDYITKPVSATALDSALARWLPAVDTVSGLDRARLEELSSLFSSQELSHMLGDLVSEVDDQLEQVAAAISRSDLAALADAAHRITNSGRIIGAVGLTEAAMVLEGLAGDAELGGSIEVARGAQALTASWEETRAAIDGQIGSGSAAGSPTRASL
jgi:CheY-like chemotaxis protein/HPt (histidine-containing phosphotransfer) domain-containing protein